MEQPGQARPGASEPRHGWFCGVALVVLSLGLAGLLGRCAYLQLSPASGSWRTRALEQQGRTVRLGAKRGKIVDRTGRVLAADVREQGVFADPQILADGTGAAKKLAGILGVGWQELLEKIEGARGRRFVWLKRGVSVEQGTAVGQLGIRGVGLQGYQRRVYPQGSLAGPLLGFTGMDGAGLEGLELELEAELRGRAGMEMGRVDAFRRSLRWSVRDGEAVRDGANVVLSIDTVIQQVAEDELGRACEQYQAKWGAAVVMDPANGEVLAMASWPSFGPADYRGTTAGFRRNKCVADVFEPGSTFKCFVASKALEAGLFGLDEEVFCHNGVYSIGGRRLRDHGAGFGMLSFVDVVVHSSNIGMAIVGRRMRNEGLYSAVRAFGFGQKPGLGLAGESAGLVAKLEDWTSYSRSSVPMGQEIGVTPLQLLRAFCAIANGGMMYRPRVVREVVSAEGEVLWRDSGKGGGWRALKAETAEVMRKKILAQVVQRGTGKRAQLAAWRVFGKTGTAQVAGKGGYKADAYVGSFLGGAPVDEPRVCVLVVIGEPNKELGYYGGTVAAPAVKVILEETLGYLGVPTEPGPEEEGELMVRGLAD